MKILVAGAGGIGGWLAAALSRGGADVEIFARSAALERIRRDGLALITDDQSETFALKAYDTVSADQKFDLIIICVKTQDFPGLCESLRPLFRAGTAVIAAVNGLPWWFLPSIGHNIHLNSIDPDGKATAILKQVIPLGAVVHASAHAVEAGVIRVVKADRLILGDPGATSSGLIYELSACLERGNVAAPIADNIRDEIWAKLWGNMNMNPVSALTRLSSLPILESAGLREIIVAMMREFDAIGQKLGLKLPVDAEARIAITRTLGDFRTSMLADALAQRRLEHEGILGCCIELAQTFGIETPVSKIIYALLAGLDHSFTQRKPYNP